MENKKPVNKVKICTQFDLKSIPTSTLPIISIYIHMYNNLLNRHILICINKGKKKTKKYTKRTRKDT